MPIVSSKFVTPIQYEVAFNIPKAEYDKWYNRLLDEMLSRVEVAGYRPGKAPRAKLLANVNLETIERVAFQETIDKYSPEAVQEAIDKIRENNAEHFILNHNINQSDVETNDEGFNFKVVSSLLPIVDTSFLDTFKIKPVSEKELNLPSLEEYTKEEIGKFLYYFNIYNETDEPTKAGSKIIVNLKGSVDGVHKPELGGPNQEVVLGFGRYLPDFEAGLTGLKKGDKNSFKVTFPKDYFVEEMRGKTADFEVEIMEYKQGKYLDIAELLASGENPPLTALAPDVGALNKNIEQAYEENKTKVSSQALKAKLVRELVDIVPDFTLPTDDVEKEIERIMANIKRITTDENLSIAEVISGSGIPFKKEPKNEEEARAIIATYASKEFKLSLLLNYIYLKKVPQESKTTEDQVEEVAAAMVANPKQYGFSGTITKEKAKSEATERLLRAITIDWILSKIS